MFPLSTEWTTGSLTCVRDYSYACVTRGVEHTDSESAQHFFFEKLTNLSVLVTQAGFEPPNLRSLDIESDALPTEPPRPPTPTYLIRVYNKGRDSACG